MEKCQKATGQVLIPLLSIHSGNSTFTFISTEHYCSIDQFSVRCLWITDTFALDKSKRKLVQKVGIFVLWASLSVVKRKFIFVCMYYWIVSGHKNAEWQCPLLDTHGCINHIIVSSCTKFTPEWMLLFCNLLNNLSRCWSTSILKRKLRKTEIHIKLVF